MANITVIHDCDVQRRGDGSSTTADEGDFRDCLLLESDPDWPHNGKRVCVGYEPRSEKEPSSRCHGLLLYDLASFLPADATITAAVWHIYVDTTSAGAGQTFYVKRCTRNNWLEASATWNKYDGVNNWTAPGGDMDTPEVTLGDITSTGWKAFNIKTIVDDAWDDRSGICTFLMFRKPEVDQPGLGLVWFYAKNAPIYDPANGPVWVHHLRITYTLDGKTFQVVLR